MLGHSWEKRIIRKGEHWWKHARENFEFSQKFYSFDPQQHRYALIGDSNANIPELSAFSQYFCWSVSGCPVNEIWLKRYLDFLSPRTEIIYWCCSSELNNIRILDRLRSCLHYPPEKRFWTYAIWQRYCYKAKYYQTINQQDRELLLSNYLEMVNWILNTYPNVILVPHLLLALQKKLPDWLNLPPTYHYLQEQHPSRIAGFETIDRCEKEGWCIDEIGHLNVKGYRALAQKLEEGRSSHQNDIQN
ncbi:MULTISPECIES: hypothetical protein [unclassified Spirulina]|uniref:hypothetical protein n=1 Tax=unclassified Spirulina TaxID=2684457 RepID=UPI00194F4293|nr:MULTISPECIES: hypothetical protein [Spirulina]MEA5469088.1 hypothetical protein [Spirulina sp. 06S082]